MLDVATGTGHVALAAARRSAESVGIDYVPGLLEIARRRAEAEDLVVELVEADAEHLPQEDASFDVVLSAIGVMFAADHDAAARELVRVTRPGGRIGLASWTPEGFVGGILRTVGAHVSPPPGAQPATRWGTEEVVAGLLGDGVTDVRSVTADGHPALHRRRRVRRPVPHLLRTHLRGSRAGWTTRGAPRSGPTWSRSPSRTTVVRATAWSSTGSTASSRRPAADAGPGSRTRGSPPAGWREGCS